MRTLLLFAALAAAPVLAQGSIFPNPNTKKAARQLELATVSEESRAFIRTKMKNHGKELQELSLAVATVRLAEVQRLAQEIANQARLDPNAGPAIKLPPRFFELQDDLRRNAQALSDSAKANEVSGTEQNFSQVMSNCISCHAAFKK